ncbi:DUF1934 domain-containing protein [Paenibacillus sp. CAA11]|uniref:DUF1934 domain-containing protein n=1 Tax=Paenibacillus sp. CAA11 TaxID=1532905 RepID=UPI000D38CD8E|nr:DUF1934 domain-containing protein [Paenibacillus sp. CAA11]AWB42880.1 DUF1934 domain-containing protein [Paenibacillus sp. CAA11]
MTDSRTAALTLRSRQENGETTVQELRGEVFTKGSSVFVRYEEPEKGPKGGVTRTMIRISDNVLKIMRHGEVESEQTFQQGQRLPGFYRSPYTTFQLSTATHSLHKKMNGASGSIEWTYDLYVFEELSGQFALSLHIQEDNIE